MATVERYYEDENRRSAHKSQKEHGQVFTYEQIHDICSLLKEGEWPDGNYGDDECVLWSLIREELNVPVR